MKTSTYLGESVSVPLYWSVPPQLLDWVNSAEALQAISNAKAIADRAIATLNKEHEILREDLQRPITL